MDFGISNNFISQSDIYNTFLFVDHYEDLKSQDQMTADSRYIRDKEKEQIIIENVISDLNEKTVLNLSQQTLFQFSLNEVYQNDSRIQKVKAIDLSKNQIRTLQGLEYFVNLKRLCLQSNGITNIFFPYQIINIKELDLSDNLIQSIEPLKICQWLEILSLKNNKIDSTKETLKIFQSIKTISKIDLRQNPLQGDQSYRYKIISLLKNIKKLNGERITEGDRLLAKKILKNYQEQNNEKTIQDHNNTKIYYSQVMDLKKTKKIWIKNISELKQQFQTDQLNNTSLSNLEDFQPNQESFLTNWNQIRQISNDREKEELQIQIQLLQKQLQESKQIIQQQKEIIEDLGQKLNKTQQEEQTAWDNLYSDEDIEFSIQRTLNWVSQAKEMLRELQEQKQKDRTNIEKRNKVIITTKKK